MHDRQLQSRILWMLMGAFVVVGILSAVVSLAGPSDSSPASATEDVGPQEPGPAAGQIGASSTTSTSSPNSTPTSTTTEVSAEPPPRAPRYVVSPIEVQPEAKQLAADIAYLLTTYDESDDPTERMGDVAGLFGVELLKAASEPLTYPGRWSRGEVHYPQMGGLNNGRASVMVVTRQTVGSGSEVHFSMVRTLDVRLVEGASGWKFDSLASAGGTFDRMDDLALAHDVANDPRIEMPDSARLDIRAGLVDPVLLELMAELADQTSYGVTVLATGHPDNVFETERVSHHTIGAAVDIYRFGERLVIDDHGEDSATRAIVEWLYNRPHVDQLGSPWDIDPPGSKRSFTDETHQDHIHLAVGEDD